MAACNVLDYLELEKWFTLHHVALLRWMKRNFSSLNRHTKELNSVICALLPMHWLYQAANESVFILKIARDTRQ